MRGKLGLAEWVIPCVETDVDLLVAALDVLDGVVVLGAVVVLDVIIECIDTRIRVMLDECVIVSVDLWCFRYLFRLMVIS